MGSNEFPRDTVELTAEQQQELQDVYSDVVATYQDREINIQGHAIQFGAALALRKAMCPVESDALEDTRFILNTVREAGHELKPEHSDFLARLIPESQADNQSSPRLQK